MRSQFPRHPGRSMDALSPIEVSISDEKPVPAPPGRTVCPSNSSRSFQSQMRSQFPRHGEPSVTVWLLSMFQSQMRSQFPRHNYSPDLHEAHYIVSISDEKPVPAPHPLKSSTARFLCKFQSQMRSQFPRHASLVVLALLLWGVSISDEKPVPAPRSRRRNDPCHSMSFNLR